MRSRHSIVVLAVIALMVALMPVASAQTTFTQKTETLFISAGCPQDTPGTCTSTRWLGRVTGDSSSNFVTAITPADEVLFRATGQINWRDYASNNTVPAEGYRLIGGSTIKMTVQLTAQGPGVNTTVHGRVILRPKTGSSTTITGADQTILLTAPAGTSTVTFDLKVPTALDNVVIGSLTAEIGVHGVHAAAGYLNQQGGSTVTSPHLVAAG